MVSPWIIFSLILNIHHTLCTQVGWLAFMEAGSDVSFEQLWFDSSYSNTANTTDHEKSRFELMSSGAYFRSPLVDQMSQINVTELDIVLFNSEGGYMGLFPFNLRPSGNASDIEQYYLDNEYEECIIGNDSGTYSSIYIYEKGNFEMFSFMAIYMEANLAGLTGEQFIVSVNNTFGQLNDTMYFGCFEIPNPTTYENVTSVFNCTSYCLTVAECKFIGLYHITGQEDTLRCVVLTYNTIPIISSTLCDMKCPDGQLCGGEVAESASLVIVSVYTMDTIFQTKLASMKEQSITTATEEYMINYRSMVGILGDPIFISGLRIESQGVFMVATWDERCANIVKEANFYESSFNYMKDSSGTVRSFEAGFTYTFAPIKLLCMYFNTSKDFSDLNVKLQVLTNEFQLATYIGVFGVWEGCVKDEIMDQPNLIPKEDIDIFTEQLPVDLTSVDNAYIITPIEYILVLHIHALDINSTDTWIQNLKIASSVYSNILIKVQTYKNCSTAFAEQLLYIDTIITANITDSTFTHYEYFSSLLANNTDYFCAEHITIEISAIDVNGIEPYFQNSLQVKGCVIPKGLTMCSELDLIDTGHLTVNMRRLPRPVSYKRLRPSGVGLPIVDFEDGTFIAVNFKNVIEVKQVIITGGIDTAKVIFDFSYSYNIVKQNGSIVYNYDNKFGDILYIFNITLPSVYPQPFPVITVAIYACEPSVIGVTTTTNAKTTTTTTTSATSLESTSISGSSTTFSTTDITTNLNVTNNSTNSSTTRHVHPSTSSTTINTPSSTMKSTTLDPMSPTTNVKSTSLGSTSMKPNSGPNNSSSSSVNQNVSQNCVCKNVTILTEKEIEEAVAEIQQKLTVPAKQTGAFKRTKISAPDERTSSAVIGAVGITCMASVGVVVIMMDIDHIINGFKFIKALVGK